MGTVQQKSKPQQCQHVDKGVCTMCSQPLTRRRAFVLNTQGPHRADEWQKELLQSYARIAGMGAAESPDLEV